MIDISKLIRGQIVTIEYRKAIPEDAGLLINIYNASFYSDYVRYGTCPGYGNSKEMMEG